MDAASFSDLPDQRRPRGGGPVLRVTTMSDLLSLVPVVLGFEPRESLVITTVAGSRPGFHARVDLPDPADTASVTALAMQAAAAAAAQGCTRVAVLGFTSDAADESSLHRVADAVTAAGIDVVDVVRTDGSRYRSLHCRDPRCCPAGGVRYDPRSSVLRAEATLAGIAVAPDREALAARFARCSGQSAERMRSATRAAEQEVVAALRLPDLRALAHPPRRAVRPAEARGTARVDALLDRMLDRMRDQRRDRQALVRPGRDHTPADASAGPDPTTAASAAIDARLDADAASLSVWCSVICFRDLAWSRIDRTSAGLHLAVWSVVARRVLPPYEPAVLSLAAFAAWASGDGASAWCALDRALTADPDYSMARLVEDALTRCVPPDVWVPPPRNVVLGPAEDAGHEE